MSNRLPAKRGRPSEYLPEYAERAYQMCLLGATDADMAKSFGVSEQTINSWKKAYPEFLESLKKGKEIADAHVAAKLFERATGYEWTETQAVKHRTGKGTEEGVKIVEVRKGAPPDPTSAIFWLKNRQPHLWRDKVEHQHTGRVEVAIAVVVQRAEEVTRVLPSERRGLIEHANSNPKPSLPDR